jgi:hypothetical protein
MLLTYVNIFFALALFTWALALITWYVVKGRNDAQRVLDCLLAFVSERKAMIAATVTAARVRTEDPRDAEEQDAAMSEEIEQEALKMAIFDEVTSTGTMTSAQQKALNG